MPFVRVASRNHLWDGEMMTCFAGGTRVLLVALDGAIHAYEDKCAHLGVPLSKGKLAGRVLTCHAHEWQYDASTGEGLNPVCMRLKRFPVRMEGTDVFVDVEEP